MRITNSMLVSNTVWNIGKNTERLSEASERQSTQSKISLPSDDPVVATNAVKYRNYVSTVEQYQDNVSNATSWMSVTEGAISDLNDVVQEIRDKTVQAANGTQSAQSLSAIKTEITQLKKSAIDILNTSYAGRYVFAGYNTDASPYADTTVSLTNADGTTTSVSAVTYKNQYVNLGSVVSDAVATDYGASGTASAPTTPSGLASLESAYNTAKTVTSASTTTPGIYNYSSIADQTINYNIGYGSEIAVNVEGQDLVGTTSGSTLFDTIDKLLLGLDELSSTADTTSAVTGTTTIKYYSLTTDASGNATGTTSSTFTLTDILGDLDTDMDRISSVTADLGARESYVTLAKNRLSDDKTVYTKLMSNNEDVDVATATTDLSEAQTVYEASLTVGAKAITKSLLDFIT